LLTEYEEHEGVTPESQLEWLLLGVQQGDSAGQERYLQSLVDREHPASDQILEALAKCCLNTWRWPDMIHCLKLLFERRPGDLRARGWRPKGGEGQHNPEAALADYRKAVERDPASAAAHLGLAETLNRLGHNREAIEHYEVVRRRLPGSTAALLGLARCR